MLPKKPVKRTVRRAYVGRPRTHAERPKPPPIPTTVTTARDRLLTRLSSSPQIPTRRLYLITPQEDALLREQIKKSGGPGNWTAIAEALEGRSSKSCRLRWVEILYLFYFFYPNSKTPLPPPPVGMGPPSSSPLPPTSRLRPSPSNLTPARTRSSDQSTVFPSQGHR